VLAKHYHNDNGIFIYEAFRNDCADKKQTLSFSGVGAEHQNARAERTIQTISYWALTMMVHSAIHWPSDGADNVRIWAFAVSHAAWLYNRLLNKNLDWRSPLEIFTQQLSDHKDLLRARVWGCPAFCLEAKLQDGHKIPKFNRGARMGQFLSFSEEHSTLVARVRNLGTNFVSPQFYVVFDEKFTTIHNNARLNDTTMESIFNNLFETCRDYFGEETIAPEGADVNLPDSEIIIDETPELGDEWLSKPEVQEKKTRADNRQAKQHEIRQSQA